MSSAAKADANRINAQSSTGPRTPEGLAASSRNSFQHGLTSKSIVLPHESQEEYDALLESMVEDHEPASENECRLVDSLAQAHWRLERCYRVETAFLQNRIEASDADPDSAMANLFIDKAETARMRLLMRYLAAAQRAFYKASADLAKAQKERKKRTAEEAEAQAFAAMYAPMPARADAPVGFVSHSAPPALGTAVQDAINPSLISTGDAGNQPARVS